MVPITIPPDAAARIAELGLEEPLRGLLDEICVRFPHLRAIEVEYDPLAGERGEPAFAIITHRVHPGGEDDPTSRQWIRWVVHQVPPEIAMHFTVLTIYEEAHAR